MLLRRARHLPLWALFEFNVATHQSPSGAELCAAYDFVMSAFDLADASFWQIDVC